MRRTGHVGTFATAPRRPHWLETALIETNTFLEQLVVEADQPTVESSYASASVALAMVAPPNVDTDSFP